MHTGTLTAPPVVTDKPTAVNYLTAFNSTSNQSTAIYLTPKTEYPLISDVSNGNCYQTNLYSYSNQNAFNNTANCTTSNSYDQAAINRRKNATRETTNTLKAWLYDHRTNPYPTKGEKIMLAIITKMTLVQVSTWFANARRRLKKENKMTWEPRNKCSNSGDEDDTSDTEYVSNENENDMNRTVLNSNKIINDTKVKRMEHKSESQGEEMNVDDVILNGTNKCDDSDSDTSSNFKRTSTPAFDSSNNNYGKGETTTNYSTTDSNYGNLENHHDRFFPYQRNVVAAAVANEQLQFSYPTNRTHNVYGHITYSTSIPPPVSNLTYVQSQMNDTSLYNQIHSHHYHNVHQSVSHHHNTTPVSLSSSVTNAQTIQQQISQQQGTNNLQQQQLQSTSVPANSAAAALVTTQQTSSNLSDSLQHTQSHHHPTVYHHVPNLNAHSNYSLLQSTYPTDYMLTHPHNHQLHQTNNSQNSIYYPSNVATAPPPSQQQSNTATTLTQLSTPVQSTNTTNLSRASISDNLYTGQQHSLIKPILNSSDQNSNGNKSDENNNLENNSNSANSPSNSTNSQLNALTLDNTRKIWSLAQTATDSHSIMSTNSTLSQDNTSAASYIDTIVDNSSNNQQQHQLVNNSNKGHQSPSIHSISTYMNGHSSSDSSLSGANNQLTNYNSTNSSTLHHQNYSLDCGQLTHNSNTFLGKVFFDYISTGTAGPLEHDRNSWTRIGLL